MVLVVSLATFALAAASPFDPLEAYLGGSGDGFTEAERGALRETLGLNQHWFAAWWHWLTGLFTGDLGYSRTFHEPVAQVLADRLGWTALLGLSASVVAIVLSAALGATAGLKAGGLADRLISGFAVILYAVPPFIVALGSVLLFAVTLRWVPAAGVTDSGDAITAASTLRHLFLPALVLGISQVPPLALGLREAITRAADGDAVRGAQARGLPRRIVQSRHILPMAAAPFFALIGGRLPELLVGATVVETVFAWPGLGDAVVNSARALDFPLLAVVVVLTVVVVVVGNLAADVAAVAADPRIEADG
ncbi:ABC transporter permease [Kribbella albertanoniae]|uniref:ABC transporter permease n=1 Tax=Kribbella albertanoniae TaxID=1266829 RepID=A0A4R4PXH8_9ACTN|nr:ABC transporter permease [Kribbella albertanoniae]